MRPKERSNIKNTHTANCTKGITSKYKGNISCKDGHNKGQKWYGPNRSKCYKERVTRIHRRTMQKGFHDPDNHNGVITHLEPDILECEVKWALESITTNKASGGMEFQWSCFKS